MRERLLVAVLCAVTSLFTALGQNLPFDGMAFDLAVAGLYRLGVAPKAGDPAVTVLLLDDRSLAAPELSVLPRALMTPIWSNLIETVMQADPRALGFDMVMQYSAGALLPNYDRDFLQSLDRHHHRIVLGRTIQTSVATPFHFAVRADEDPIAEGLAEVINDPDGVARSANLTMPAEDGSAVPTLVGALARRAGLLDTPDSFLPLPTGPLETAVPAYSVIDILRCRSLPEGAARLHKLFAQQIVLIGSGTPDEDRRVAADRFMPLAKAAPVATRDCEFQPAGVSAPGSGTVPGVFLHALAIDAASRGLLVGVARPWSVALAAALLSLVGAVLAFSLAPWPAFAAAGAVAIVGLGMDVALLGRLWWLPPVGPLIGLGRSVVAAYIARYLFEERRRRRIQHAFCHYLSPMLVDSLAEDQRRLTLGGETRDVTVMFADLSGFTALSTVMAPEALMGLTNRYLAHIVDAVEATGGYVDKFIGDAVMAIWGAPADDPDHARHAVLAALDAAARVAAERAATPPGDAAFRIKIGLASGPVVVGNVGTANRFNYTAVGETVNLASRLESVPGHYGCTVVMAETTARAVGPTVLSCELDAVTVKGKNEPLHVYVPLGPSDAGGTDDTSFVAVHSAALAKARAGDLEGARSLWTQLLTTGPEDGPARGIAAAMIERLDNSRSQGAAMLGAVHVGK